MKEYEIYCEFGSIYVENEITLVKSTSIGKVWNEYVGKDQYHEDKNRGLIFGMSGGRYYEVREMRALI